MSSSGYLPDPGIEPTSMFPAVAGRQVLYHWLSNPTTGNVPWENHNWKTRGPPQDGGGIGQGDHFLPHEFIKRSFECWATSTKQLLNAGGGHQAPRKAVRSFRKEVRQNIKDKKRDKRVRDRDPSRGESHEGGEVSKHQETLSTTRVWGVLESQRAT